MNTHSTDHRTGAGAGLRETTSVSSTASRYTWRVRAERVPSSIDEVLALLLELRGITPQAAPQFLTPPASASLLDPFLLPQCGAAVLRVQRALRAGEHIAIFGDYDVDGVTGSALLAEALALLGAAVSVELPHRDDGYGLSVSAVRRLVPPAQLLITVDNGTSAAEAIGEAARRGAEVIVLDHHAVTGGLPAGALIVNPALPSSRYPVPYPSAVGVAWKWITALFAAEGRAGEETLLLDLVALGTLADSVPLVGENRLLVQWGIDVLRHTRRPGLEMLVEQSGLRLRDVTADALTFRIVPRLNAAGRLRHANLALELLRTRDQGLARRLAAELDGVNGERKQMTEEILDEVLPSVPSPVPPVIMVFGPWPVGLLGVLANRLAEHYHRPAVAVAVRDLECIASLRGAPRGAGDGPNMVEMMRDAEHLLTRFGGHAGAAGFTFPRAALEAVADFFQSRPHPHTPGQPPLLVDCSLPPSLVTAELARALERLEPFGTGNESPVFLLSGLAIAESRLVGSQNNHLRFVFRHPGTPLPRPGVAFRWGTRPRPSLGATVDIAAEIRHDTFRGIPRADLHVRDIRSAA